MLLVLLIAVIIAIVCLCESEAFVSGYDECMLPGVTLIVVTQVLRWFPPNSSHTWSCPLELVSPLQVTHLPPVWDLLLPLA